MDVLVTEAGESLILKRYWLPEPGETVDPARSEFRALALASRAGVPAPTAMWLDESGIFPERGVITSFVPGRPLIHPDDAIDWSTQLAKVLLRIHTLEVTPADNALFPRLGAGDPHRSWSETADTVSQHGRGREIWDALVERRDGFQEVVETYVHHDFWPGNTMWVGQKLGSVIDWEGGCVADPALDVACCAFDIAMLGLHEAADHFVETYRRLSERPLVNLGFWRILAVCRPLPDISVWVPGWRAVGFPITTDEARSRHAKLIDDALRD